MKSRNTSKSPRTPSRPPKPNSSSGSYHLTPSEIESLRKDKKALTAWLKTQLPGLRTA